MGFSRICFVFFCTNQQILRKKGQSVYEDSKTIGPRTCPDVFSAVMRETRDTFSTSSRRMNYTKIEKIEKKYI